MPEMFQPSFDLFSVRRFDTFGERLEAIRKSRNLTQNQLCLKSGISRTSISSYECNKHKPYVRSMHKLAAALRVECATLEDSLHFYEQAPEILTNYDSQTGDFFLYREK